MCLLFADTLRSFTLLTDYRLEKFLSIKEQIYEEVVRLFYANMTVPYLPEGTDFVIQSNLLGTQIEFTLSNLCQILELPNTMYTSLPWMICQHVALQSLNYIPSSFSPVGNRKLPLNSSSIFESSQIGGLEMSSLVLVTMTMSTHSSLFLPPSYRLENKVCYIIFGSMLATYTAISGLNPPDESKLSLPYWMLLNVILLNSMHLFIAANSQNPMLSLPHQ